MNGCTGLLNLQTVPHHVGPVSRSRASVEGEEWEAGRRKVTRRRQSEDEPLGCRGHVQISPLLFLSITNHCVASRL